MGGLSLRSRKCWGTSPLLCGITVYRLLILRVEVSLEDPEGKEKELKRPRARLVLWMCEGKEVTGGGGKDTIEVL